MYTTTTSAKELAFTTGNTVGSKGIAVKRLQEWLGLNGTGTAIDSDFGSATLAALKKFQADRGHRASNSLTQSTWDALVQPMVDALADLSVAPASLPEACVAVANQHLSSLAREVGGDNCGPWVRLYTGGRDGADWAWCAGFVSFVLTQSAALMQVARPIKGSVSCDTLAAQAQQVGRFVSGKSLGDGGGAEDALGSCAIFLIRRTPGDWTHTGFAYNFRGDVFDTLEGNTNDDGSRNGYEVCKRFRKLSVDKDFIFLG